MSATALCVAVVMLGVNYDIQPLPDGGVEYIFRVKPLDLQSLNEGSDLRSDLSPAVKDVRSFCIRLEKDRPAGASLPFAAASPLSNGQPTPAPAPLLNPPELTGAGGSKFPPTSSAIPPLPKIDDGIPKQAAQQTNFEQNPFGQKTPSTSNPFQRSSETPGPATAAKPPNDPHSSKEPATPAAEKPQPPKAPSQTELQSPGPETEKESPRLVWGLWASTAGSFSGMLFFGWVAADYRRRYYSLLSRSGQTPEMAGWEPEEEEPASEDPPVSADD